MKLRKIIAAAAALATVALIASAPAQAATHNRYGGVVYKGAPALHVTASFVKAGGGAANFSSVKLLNALAGSKLAKAEIHRLTMHYGKARIQEFVKVGDFAVKHALGHATAAGVKLPSATQSGTELAKSLINAGLQKDGTFYYGTALDHIITNKIHNQTMDDITRHFGATADANYHKITNLLFYDMAQALGMKNVKLSRYH